MNNLKLQILFFSLLIVIMRLFLGAMQFDFRYLIDFALFISYSFTTFFNYKKSKRKKYSDFYLSIVTTQIIFSIIFFEIAKLIIFSPELSLEYFYARLIVFIYIMILGLIASGISLLVFGKHIRENSIDNINDNVFD
jgi:hypothetical protein